MQAKYGKVLIILGGHFNNGKNEIKCTREAEQENCRCKALHKERRHKSSRTPSFNTELTRSRYHVHNWTKTRERCLSVYEMWSDSKAG